jgi:hypothetical protein
LGTTDWDAGMLSVMEVHCQVVLSSSLDPLPQAARNKATNSRLESKNILFIPFSLSISLKLGLTHLNEGMMVGWSAPPTIQPSNIPEVRNF